MTICMGKCIFSRSKSYVNQHKGSQELRERKNVIQNVEDISMVRFNVNHLSLFLLRRESGILIVQVKS